MRFSVIIVSYNSSQHIGQCLKYLLAQDFSDYEVLIIDNASTDKTLSLVNVPKDRINVYTNGRNEGFSVSFNKGIWLSQGEYILTLNPDVILENNFLSEINRNINKLDKNVGMLGVKILRINSARIIDSTGLVLSKFFRFFDRGSGEKDKGQYDQDNEILGPCAAAGIYKRALLDDLRINGEYFDNDFFYLLEDFDIALRARKRGWKSLYLPEAVCYHQRNGSGMSYRYRQRFTFRNRYFLLIKNIELKPEFILYFIIYDIPRLFFLSFINPQALITLINARQSFIKMFKKRKSILRCVQKEQACYNL